MSYVTFDGSQGRIEVTGYLGVAGIRHRSVTFWLRTTTDFGTLVWWGNDPAGVVNGGEQNRIRMVKGRLQLFGRGSFRETASVLNDGAWHHVAFSWTRLGSKLGHDDFSQAHVYIDNVLDDGLVRGGAKLKIRSDGTESTDISIDTAQDHFVVIGARPTVTGTFMEFYQGDMDDFAIYDDVLHESTISGLYNSGSPGVDILSLGQVPALELLYLMGDGVGDTAPAGTMMDQQLYYVARDGITSSGTAIV